MLLKFLSLRKSPFGLPAAAAVQWSWLSYASSKKILPLWTRKRCWRCCFAAMLWSVRMEQKAGRRRGFLKHQQDAGWCWERAQAPCGAWADVTPHTASASGGESLNHSILQWNPQHGRGRNPLVTGCHSITASSPGVCSDASTYTKDGSRGRMNSCMPSKHHPYSMNSPNF